MEFKYALRRDCPRPNCPVMQQQAFSVLSMTESVEPHWLIIQPIADTGLILLLAACTLCGSHVKVERLSDTV